MLAVAVGEKGDKDRQQYLQNAVRDHGGNAGDNTAGRFVYALQYFGRGTAVVDQVHPVILNVFADEWHGDKPVR